MVGIYKIQNIINSKLYIGQTKCIRKRFYTHKSLLKQNKHKNYHLQAAWNKYGEQNFIFEILEKCDVNFLAEKELYWCNFYKSHNSNYGYNLTIILPNRKYNLTEEGKRKIALAHKGMKHTIETKLLISKANIGKKLSNETKNKMSKSKKGRKLSTLTKEKMSRAKKHQFKIKPLTQNNKWIVAKSKKVFGLNIQNKDVTEFNSIKEAAFNTNTKPTRIVRCCKNKSYHTGGYVWSYKSHDLEEKLARLPIKEKKELKIL